MNTISLTYPESGLTVNVSVYVKGSGTLDNSGVATETGTTKTYIYEFTGTPSTDYVYVATSQGYQDIGGVVFANNEIAADIWGAQISDYSGTAGTFATKFEQYGGVSHVIHDKKGAELTVEEKELLKKNSELLDKVSKKLDEKDKFHDEEISKIIQSLKSPQNKPNVVVHNPIPLLTEISRSIKELQQKEIKIPEQDDSGIEIIAGILTELIPDISSKLELLFEAFKGYDTMLAQSKLETDKYKKLLKELT